MRVLVLMLMRETLLCFRSSRYATGTVVMFMFIMVLSPSTFSEREMRQEHKTGVYVWISWSRISRPYADNHARVVYEAGMSIRMCVLGLFCLHRTVYTKRSRGKLKGNRSERPVCLSKSGCGVNRVEGRPLGGTENHEGERAECERDAARAR